MRRTQWLNNTVRLALPVGSLILVAPMLAVTGICWEQSANLLCCPVPSPRACLSNEPGNPAIWDCTDLVNRPPVSLAQVRTPPLPGHNGHQGYIKIDMGDCIRTPRSCKNIAIPVPPDSGCTTGTASPSDCESRFEDQSNIPCDGPPADPGLPQ